MQGISFVTSACQIVFLRGGPGGQRRLLLMVVTVYAGTYSNLVYACVYAVIYTIVRAGIYALQL